MVCKYCKKRLPDEPGSVCPHCFAEWTPEGDEKQGGKKSSKTEEPKTVNGHD